MENSKRVLIISFHYLPEVMAASYRIHAWAKYLPSYGWKPIILTRTQDDIDAQYSTNESTQAIKVFDKGAGCTVYRADYRQKFESLWNLRSKYTRMSDPSRINVFIRKLLNFLIGNLFMLPDERYDWFPDAIRAGKIIIEKHDIQAILSTGAPWTDFLIAKHLSREAGIPWIADYRDPWSQPTTLGFQKQYFMRASINRFWEKRLMRTASAIIQISKPLQISLSRMLDRKVDLIPNGFDPERFRLNSDYSPNGRRFRISFIGTLHNNTITRVFAEGFHLFVQSTAVKPENCQVEFIGDLPGFKLVRETYSRFKQIEDFFSFEPPVSQMEANRRMCNSHVVLSFPLDMAGCCPAKTFEYLASGRPILVSPGGRYRDEISRILSETGGGIILNTPEEVSAWLGGKFKEFRITGTVKSDTDLSVVQKYSRINQVNKLSLILDEAIGQPTLPT